jgi:hypothetical protein
MTKREMIEALLKELRLIDGGTSVLDYRYTFELDCHENVYSQYKFLEEVNDFPTICFSVVEETVAHIGGDVRYKTALISLRGYVHQDIGEQEDSNWWAEALLDDIEHVLKYVRERNRCFVDVRILELSTDEGIMTPYGVADMILSITYEAE